MQSLLSKAVPGSLTPRWQGIGNLLKLIITVLGTGTDAKVQKVAFSSRWPDVVVEALRQAPDDSAVRKNAAVVIAKLAKHPEVSSCTANVRWLCVVKAGNVKLCAHVDLAVMPQSQARLRENGGIQALVRLQASLV